MKEYTAALYVAFEARDEQEAIDVILALAAALTENTTHPYKLKYADIGNLEEA